MTNNTIQKITWKDIQDVMEKIGLGLSEQNVRRVMDEERLSEQDAISAIKDKQQSVLGCAIDYSADDNAEIDNPALSILVRCLDSEFESESQQGVQHRGLEKYLDAVRKEIESHGLSLDDDNLFRKGWTPYVKRENKVDGQSSEDGDVPSLS